MGTLNAFDITLMSVFSLSIIAMIVYIGYIVAACVKHSDDIVLSADDMYKVEPKKKDNFYKSAVVDCFQKDMSKMMGEKPYNVRH